MPGTLLCPACWTGLGSAGGDGTALPSSPCPSQVSPAETPAEEVGGGDGRPPSLLQFPLDRTDD